MMARKIKFDSGRDKKRSRANARARKSEPRARKDDDADRSTFKVALQCASVGLPVVPLHGKRMGGACTCDDAVCETPGMHPRTGHGVGGATTDPERVKYYWSKCPSAKIGIATGGDAGIIAIGLEEDAGRTSLKELQERNSPLPKTVTIRSTNRRAYFFRIGNTRLNRAVRRLGKGISVLGDGRFVVAPFDLHDPDQARRFVDGRGPGEIEIAAAPPWLLNLITEPTSTASPAAASVVLVRTSDIVPEKIEWLWRGFIATGRLTGLVGYPGLGKSHVGIDLAARVSTGRDFPGGGRNGKPAHVVILSAEDHPADTIVPRLIAAGADLSRIHIVRAVKDGDGERPFNLSLDLDRLEKECNLTEVKLLLIDPANAYLASATGNRINRNNSGGDIRRGLARLTTFAEQHELAVVAVSHLNKTRGASAITRIMGSTEWVAVPRAVFLVAKESGTDRHLFLPVKNNLGPDRIGYAFRIVDRVVADGISTSTVVWDPDPVTTTADEALAVTGKQASSAPIDFLQQTLSDGPMDQAEIVQLGKEAGFTEKSLRTAREKLGIKSRKEGFGASGKWVWVLPSGTAPTLIVNNDAPPDGTNVDDAGMQRERPEDTPGAPDDGGAA